MVGEQLGFDFISEACEEKEMEIVKVPENIRIRKLTPKECWRLMGFDDESFERARKENSNSRLYMQAGNSICVNCLEMIFGQMFEGKEDFWKRWLREKGYGRKENVLIKNN